MTPPSSRGRPREHPVVRRVVLRHVVVAAAMSVFLSALVVAGLWRFAQDQSRENAEQVAAQVAATVLGPMARHDYSRPDSFDRSDLRDRMTPFLSAGMVDRVKLFTVRGDHATIVFSDDPQLEGRTGYRAPGMTDRLQAGGVVVKQVPRDAAHQYETSLPGNRLEVFFGFLDAAGSPTHLELYIPVRPAGIARQATGVLLPVLLAGAVLLTAAMMPLSIAMARRVERDRAETRAARRYGLAAAQLTRERLARRLHDHVIPSLAAAGLLLDRARIAPSPPPATAGPAPPAASATGAGGTAGAGGAGSDLVLAHVQGLLAHETQELRAMLTELLTSAPPDTDIRAALHQLAAEILTTGLEPEPIVTVIVEDPCEVDSQTASILCQVATELLRNIARHASARTVQVRVSTPPGDQARTVELLVTDDGAGFDPAVAAPPDHIGLRLVHRLLTDHDGRLTVTSAPGAGTTATVTMSAGPPRSGGGHRPRASWPRRGRPR
ncbi:histidine kinase [Parafrankia sp. EUN1f]|nr:histidine kinase [Parafrankia sp. EUN1f]